MRARDLILARKRQSIPDVLAGPRPGATRQVGPQSGYSLRQGVKVGGVKRKPSGARRTLQAKQGPSARQKHGRHYGPELVRAQLMGDIPTRDLSTPYPRNPNARREREAAQAGSPHLLEEIKRRLTGDRLGSRTIADEDFEQLGFLHRLGSERKSQGAILAKQRAAIRKKLEGQVGIVRRFALMAAEASLGVAAKAGELAKDIVARLTGDALQRKLAGFGLHGRSEIPKLPTNLPDLRTTTPRQNQQMTRVMSSNVASVGWEPHDQQARIGQQSAGTLFIQFLNGWLYEYADAPFWLYEAILRAPSKGKAVWGLLRRGLYPDGIPYGSLSREGYERIR